MQTYLLFHKRFRWHKPYVSWYEIHVHVAVPCRKWTLFRLDQNRVFHTYRHQKACYVHFSITIRIARLRDELDIDRQTLPVWAFLHCQFLHARRSRRREVCILRRLSDARLSAKWVKNYGESNAKGTKASNLLKFRCHSRKLPTAVCQLSGGLCSSWAVSEAFRQRLPVIEVQASVTVVCISFLSSWKG